MTERTHDMAGLTCLTIAFLVYSPSQLSLVTLVTVILANQIGASFPDLDQPTAEFYRELPAGSLLGHLFAPLLGSHRHISHSILGIAIYSWLFHLLLIYLSKFILVDMNLVWWAFTLGFVSHLIMDSLTKEGVPLFFPVPIRIGFPPFKSLRLTTGKVMEKIVVYPGLVVLNGYLIYMNYNKVVDFFSNQIIR